MDLLQQISQGITGSPCSMHVCFKSFYFNATYQFKLLLTLHHLIFGLTPFGCLHTRMLLRVYETHGTEDGCGLTLTASITVQSPFSSHCYSVLCLFVFI
jgi:hypothetical protein